MVSQPGFDFGTEVAKLVPILLRAVHKQLETLIGQWDLSVSHFVVLDMLKEKGECRMTDIATAMNLSMSTSTVIIDKMIDMDLVGRKRSEKDRRVVFVYLKRRGVDASDKLNKARKEIVSDIFSDLEEGEREAYLNILKKVCANIARKGGSL